MNNIANIPPMHFADWFQRHALTRPSNLAVATPRLRLTYAEFYLAVQSVIHRLSDCGVEPGQTVAICAKNSALHCVLIVALNRMGVVVLSVSRPPPNQKMPIPNGILVDRVLIEQPYDGAAEPRALDIDVSWLKIADGKVAPWQGRGFRDRDEMCRIFTSSGTTGTAKAMGLSTRQIESRMFKRSTSSYILTPFGGTVNCFGLHSQPGFNAAFSTFWMGGSVFMDWPGGVIPGVIARNRVERIEASPAQYSGILKDSDPSKFDLSSLRIAYFAGSVAPSPLVAAIKAKFCKSVIVGYGSTEMGVIAFGPLRADDPPGHCGHLGPWAHAQVVDAEGNILPPGVEGVLRFRCEDMISAYLNDPQASAEYFRDGWFYPGDIGTVSSERLLWVSGRSSERINAGGVKVDPAHVENAVLSHEAVEECAAFGVPDAMGVEQIWAAIVVNQEINLAALRKYCIAKLGGKAPVRFLILAELPRNEAGKILRTALQKQAQSVAAGSDMAMQ